MKYSEIQKKIDVIVESSEGKRFEAVIDPDKDYGLTFGLFGEGSSVSLVRPVVVFHLFCFYVRAILLYLHVQQLNYYKYGCQTNIKT